MLLIEYFVFNVFYVIQGNYTNSVTKVTTVGSAVIYSVTIPNTSTNKDAAIKYILNIRSQKGLHYVLEEGINQLKESSFYGNLSAIPEIIFSQNITA